ncbi:NAD+ synthase [Legionella oakridgensis]|uniref:Glutamine-dependent NAD(+) synthetase n=2 Tax=Legionella oakridgensis TaxID=29423 RepID=W0BFL1_9GAMM|nr:NAD+ synthase [Legionella oakridgensis]AHE67481.1 NAD+ synthetase [Legionella oakridgensis ATCC 33761 = DSM 21215]ETO93010.1 NH(3)-dependent NAD(+) synthetase [Legionella oakridgensis RV-2-2007]KTD43538.1 glutamine dependent NAD+ synthetase [Legionella oakridgensis]STY20530.1 NAD synthase (glutamine-hydrolysing) [Legionella longbeachae]
MPQALTLLMAQINPTVGAITANTEKIINVIQTHQEHHDVIVFPELTITGYPPEDLLFRHELYRRVEQALETIQKNTQHCYVVIGHPSLHDEQRFNAASVLHKGMCIAHYHKQMLPNYGVFDEERYFTAGKANPCVWVVKGYQLGLCICEDLWQTGPVDQLIQAKTDLMICINASPFDYEKYSQRETLLRHYAKQGLSIVYVNQIGGQDELLFDGQSLAMNHEGQVMARAPAFTEHLQTIQFKNHHLQGTITPLLVQEALIYQALVCGLRDYIEKNGFPGVLLGLSGGIDSALTLAIAVDALGAERVHAVMMPSRYTAAMSLEDAMQQLNTLQVQHTTLSIEPAFKTLLTTLAASFTGLPPDVTEENMQARIRGLLLMALSNKTGNMVITTSNKSEAAVGYATLYGDMVGGFAVLKDVLKTQVYALARYRNSISAVIPERVFTRAPSAELAENQTDQDTLPDYTILDAIITYYMEYNLSAEEISERGYPLDIVQRVIKLITRNEYKRRQSAPGIKISSCAFGRDWRYPITSGFTK